MPQTVQIQCNIKAYRQAKGWSQVELAEKIQVRRQAIYDMESGKYLPNTAVALLLAKIFTCSVEELFTAAPPAQTISIELIDKTAAIQTKHPARLTIGKVRNKLIGIPMHGMQSFSLNLRPADALLEKDRKSAQLLTNPENLDSRIIIMGCDPAIELLGKQITRLMPNAEPFCVFASSGKALQALAQGTTHIAGTHFHNQGNKEANVAAVQKKIPNTGCLILGFSFLEEGLMVAKNNPLNVQTAADMAAVQARFVNRENGAALRTLFNSQLKKEGIPSSAINGYSQEVFSHYEGAFHVACKAADVALGIQVVAEAFNLDFIPLAATRCDLIIPTDLQTLPAVKALLDILQSSRLQKILNSLPGYDTSFVGKIIARV